jgi:two-component system, OmpR family, sensor histidine kinase KdpD
VSGLAAGATTGGSGWRVGAAVLETIGALIAAVWCYLDLTRVFEDQTLQLSDSEVEAVTADARERVRTALMRSQHHDLVNAITAIDGAASILERDFDKLSGRDRETLAGVLGSGTARLRRLLEQEEAVPGQVSLAETAAAVAKNPAWHQYLEVDVGADLLAAGSAGETTEAVRQLVDFAFRRAPDSPVTIRGERDGDWAVLRVEDRGPTVPREVRRTMVDPDPRRGPGREDSREVRVAARLMRDQGGDLWVEARPGGGSSFGVCLPSAPATERGAGGDKGAR